MVTPTTLYQQLPSFANAIAASRPLRPLLGSRS